MSDMDAMINFHAIAEPMSIVKSLYATRDWHISGDDSKIKSWLEKAIRMLWDKFISDSMTAMEYGYAGGVKNMFLGSDGNWWIKSISPLKPHYLTILADDMGKFAGYEQNFSEGLDKESMVKIYNAEDVFHYAYNSKFDDPYGNSRLVAARHPYIVYKYIIEMTCIFYENYISPSKIGRAPAGKGKTKDGVERFNIDIMSDKLKDMEIGGAKDITVPSETDEKGTPRWDVKLLESSRTGADYMEFLKFLKTEMANGVLVPELAFAQTGSGSYNLFDGQEAFLAYKSDLDMSQFADAVNSQIIDYLVDLNFGADFVGQYRLEFTKASSKDKELSKQVVQALTQNNSIEFDYDQLSRMTGLKITKNVVAMANQVQAIKDGAKTKEQVVVNKPVETKKGQMELPLCDCKAHFEESKRPLTPAETRVDFEKINDIYESEEEISQALANLLRTIQARVISKVEKPYIAGDILKLKQFALDNKVSFTETFIQSMASVFSISFDEVNRELGFNKKVTSAGLDLASIKAEEMAVKQLSDIEFAMKNTLLAGATTGAGFDIIKTQVNDYFNDFINKKMTAGVAMGIQEMVDDGRRAGADDPEVELAQWSAVLDENVCDLCESFDMKVVDVNSSEYDEYTPGNLHNNCRCVWIYILRGEKDKPPVDFGTPDKTLIDKYMRR